MKKFKEGEIFINTVKAYPRSEFKCNSGVVTFNRQNYPSANSRIPIESIGLNELINPVPIDLSPELLLLENEDALLVENGDFIILD